MQQAAVFGEKALSVCLVLDRIVGVAGGGDQSRAKIRANIGPILVKWP